MNLQDLETLLDYNYWARDRLLQALEPLTPAQLKQELGGSFGSIHDTVAHLYAAEHVWYSRWNGASPPLLKGDAFPDLSAIKQAWLDIEPKIRVFAGDLGDAGVDRVFEFKMLSGQPAAAPFWQMLQHVVNHGSYHRGQVTNKLRQLDAAPPKSLDMIAFFRSQGVKA
jgi:uncharacterized damage-inducible protein DinB